MAQGGMIQPFEPHLVREVTSGGQGQQRVISYGLSSLRL